MTFPLLDSLAATAAQTNFLAIAENFMADAHRGVTLVAHDHDVGGIDGGFLLQDAAGLLGAPRFGMALDHVDSLDNHPVLVLQHAQDFAGLAPLSARSEE